MLNSKPQARGLCRSRKAWHAGAVLLLCLPLVAEAAAKRKGKGQSSAPPAAIQYLTPAISVLVKNGSDLERFRNANSWLKDFSQSNLHDGLTLRLGQVLSALPAPEQEKTWKGQLQDFVFSKVIQNKPMIASYYYQQGLSSPFAIAFPNLGSTEMAIIKEIFVYFANGDSEEVDLQPLTDASVKVKVNPVRIGNFRFAFRVKDNCLAMSRDPRLAVMQSEACQSQAQIESPVEIQLDWRKMISSLGNFMQRYLQTSGQMKLSGEFQGGELKLKKATLPWALPGRLGPDANSADFLNALPADTAFYSFLSLRTPEQWDTIHAVNFLKGKKEGTEQPVQALVFFVPGESSLVSGLLLAGPQIKTQMGSIRDLIPSVDTHVSLVCGDKFLLISTQLQADFSDAVCSGKVASLAKIRSNLVQAISSPAASGLFLNIPSLSTAFLRFGWARENKTAPQPPELQKTTELLKRISLVYAGGHLKNSTMEYTITQGDL